MKSVPSKSTDLNAVKWVLYLKIRENLKFAEKTLFLHMSSELLDIFKIGCLKMMHLMAVISSKMLGGLENKASGGRGGGGGYRRRFSFSQNDS